ncbi:MAG TPA: ATP-binding protein [Casimicrobiaceae bacterium]|nr:ATP-binding protein [Casimicrobiaceae bacterium]
MPARSIRRDLVVWISAGLLVAIAIAAIATYLRAREEANEIFDYQLKQMSSSLTGVPLAGAPPGSSGSDALVVQVWDRDGVQVYLSQPQQPLPRDRQPGFSTIRTAAGEWRVFSTLAGDQIVQVAQPLSVRRELAASMALRTIVPLLAVVPFLVLFVWFGIARGLSPLERVAVALAERSPWALRPLNEAGLPTEVAPLVHALNGLLDRLDHALDAQRAFIADAAHELRTPLTAVHLQAQLAERATTDAERSAALRELRAGLERATRLVEQLLTLAREEPGVSERPFLRVDLTELARQVLAEYAAIAAARGVDLGLAEVNAATDEAIVTGDADALRTLASNLVDNAVRHAAAGGRVDVGTQRDGAAILLTVRDSGPGIPESERERVFDRFYRAPGEAAAGMTGSGLGLAIVRRIAERHGASVTLGTGLAGPKGEGLGVTVRLQAASPTTAA